MGFIAIIGEIALVIIIAGFTASIAESKGYDPGPAFIWGCIFNIWALLVYLILSNKKSTSEQRSAATLSNAQYHSTGYAASGHGNPNYASSSRDYSGDREAIDAFGEGSVRAYHDLDDGANMGMDSFEYLSWKDSCDDD